MRDKHFFQVLSSKRAGHAARTGEIRNAHKILIGKPEGKRP